MLFVAAGIAPAAETPAVPADPPTTALVPAAPPEGRTTTQIVVSVVVNTVAKGDVFVELADDGILFLATKDLDALNLKYDEGRAVFFQGERYAPTGAVLDVTPAFDERKLVLSFIGKTTESQRTTAEIFHLHARPQDVYVPRETSAFLNYGLASAQTTPNGFGSFSATTKIGARTGDVFFVSDQLYTRTDTAENFVRLQSSATFERRGELQWFTAGDQFARSGDLGSTVNMGGIGFSKVYKIDPYFITQPTLDLQGSVIYPTQAEVYLDGVLVGRQQIAPGIFDLKNIFSYTGSHRVEVVLKDPFGQEQRIVHPVYFNTVMLRKGLHEYSYNLGFLREQYGLRSAEYGKAVFSAFHRYGVSNSLNIGVNAEGSDQVYNGGLLAAFLLPRIGAVTLAAAASDANGKKGSAASALYSYQFRSFNANIRARTFSRDYATVGMPSVAPAEQIRYERSTGVGLLLLPLGSLALTYSETGNYGGESSRVVSANYSRTLTRMISFFATASRTRQTRAKDLSSLFVGFNFNFDVHLHGAVQHARTGDTITQTAQLQQDVPVGEGFGYRATLSRSETGSVTSQSVNPNVQYNGPYGTYTADVNAQKVGGRNQETYTLSAAGALVYAGGFYGLSRPVNDSFSIVMLDKVADARVLNNGQEIGTTGTSGKLIVPTITSYGRNQITVDVRNLPMEYSISGVNRALSPSLWSGSCVAFDAVRMQAVTGTLVATTDGKKTPIEYVEVSLQAGERTLTFPTGKSGEFYIENTVPQDRGGDVDPQSCRSVAERRKRGGKALPAGVYPASVKLDGKTCTFRIAFPETEEVITDLGEVACVVNGDKPQPTPPAPPAVQPEPQLPPPPPLVVPPALTSEENPIQSVVVDLQFDAKGSLASKRDRSAVAALVRKLKKSPELSVAIETHGDRHGTLEASRRVGRKRADAMRKYLIAAGVPPDRIASVRSKGKEGMLCADPTQACDKMNQRGIVRLVRREDAAEREPKNGEDRQGDDSPRSE